MDALPYYLGFSALCFLASFGLFHRKVWVWYLGWVFLYVVASCFGSGFFTALREARNPTQEAYACVYLAGGLLFWLPFVVWWSNRRSSFGVRSGEPEPSSDH